jgi:hypothetical protein
MIRLSVLIAPLMLTVTTNAVGQTATPATTQSLPSSSAPAPDTSTSRLSADGVMAVPFRLGESADYDVKFGFVHVGSANTAVVGIDDVRGHPAWHTTFRVKGGTFFYHVNDIFESWIDRETFSSLRFWQTQQEGSKDRIKRYEIYPDLGTVTELDKQPPRTFPGVKNPLDDGSFLFYIRTLPLSVGQTYESNRYFRLENNPVRVRVLRKETITVPAGKFDCIVVQPMIRTKGIFSEDGHAEVWLTDDPRHIVIQLKAHLKFGSISLYLRSYKPGA